MYATNFEYDGLKASDYGVMICRFDSASPETVSSGADIYFDTVRPSGSNKFKMYGSKYTESYSSTFQICKNPDTGKDLYFNPNEISALQRWLCKKDNYHQFHPIQDDLKDIYWNATFSCKQININGKIAGLELTLYTDSPYAYVRQAPIFYSVLPGESFSLYDTSDEVGWIYPTVTITCKGNGNIDLQNNLDNKILRLTNLSKGETIILNSENKLITSSFNRSDLQNNFNFYYPRIFNKIINGIDVRENIFTLSATSIPCDITFEYSPTIKIGL